MARSTPSAPLANVPSASVGGAGTSRLRLDALTALSALVAALAAIAAAVGLFSRGGTGPFPFTTLRGEVVEIYGRGLYRNDTVFVGALNRGTDAVTLFLAVPLLVLAIVWSRHGSLRGRLLLTGTLAYSFYVYGSLALGTAAYNDLYLVYLALFSGSLFALILACRAIDLADLDGRLTPRAPSRGLAVFLLASGALTAGVWLGMTLLPAIVRGEAALLLDGYTTFVTYTLDLGIIAPACGLAAVLLRRRAPSGYALAAALLGILALLGPAFAAQTISQLAAGVTYSPGEIIGPIGGFGAISLIADWLLLRLLRGVGEAAGRTEEHAGVAKKRAPSA